MVKRRTAAGALVALGVAGIVLVALVFTGREPEKPRMVHDNPEEAVTPEGPGRCGPRPSRRHQSRSTLAWAGALAADHERAPAAPAVTVAGSIVEGLRSFLSRAVGCGRRAGHRPLQAAGPPLSEGGW